MPGRGRIPEARSCGPILEGESPPAEASRSGRSKKGGRRRARGITHNFATRLVKGPEVDLRRVEPSYYFINEQTELADQIADQIGRLLFSYGVFEQRGGLA